MTVGGQTRDADVLGRERERRMARRAGAVLHRRPADAAAEVDPARCRMRGAGSSTSPKFSLPDHRPIGSINRARWVAESASRKARLERRRASRRRRSRRWPHRLGAITLGHGRSSRSRSSPAAFALLAVAARGLPDRPDQPRRRHAAARVGRSRRLSRPGLGRRASKRRCGRPTTTRRRARVLKDVRYSWFKNLEMPWSRTKLVDPSDHAALRVPRRRRDARRIPTACRSASRKHFDQQLNEELLDITCAACHTGQINVTRNGRTTALRIDGGSALHAFTNANIGHFVPTLAASLLGTLVNPIKFNRFANAVLGPNHQGGRWALRRQMLNVAGQFGRLAWNEKVHGLVPTEEGYGRTDALARIANTVFGDHLEAGNYAVGNAPVNYPAGLEHLEVRLGPVQRVGQPADGAQHRRVDGHRREVRADGSLRQSAAARPALPLEHDPRPTSTPSSATLWKLQPPAWNEDVLGPIDRATRRARQGALRPALRVLPRPAHRAARHQGAQLAAQGPGRARVDREDAVRRTTSGPIRTPRSTSTTRAST